MKLVQFQDPESRYRSVGLLRGGEVIDAELAWRMAEVQPVHEPMDREIPEGELPRLLYVALRGVLSTAGKEFLPPGQSGNTAILRLAGLSETEMRRCLEELRGLTETRRMDWRFPLSKLHLLAPLHPYSFRDFYAFEEHVGNARRRRGLDMPPEWYEAPAFYFSNTSSILGPGAPVRKPPETRELDYELELGVVLGREGGNIPVEEADAFIAGFTIVNDWSARDVQRREMTVGLGPAKGKDFATSIGPWLVTPDELEDRVLPDRSRGKRYDLLMTARVNGREYSRGNARDMHWTFAELISHASRNTVLRPGELIGSGTVGTGCIVEFPEGTHPWLEPGDVVRLEIERLGALENAVVA